MQLIYQNDHGAVYHVDNSQNPECNLQMVVDAIGIFMSRPEIEHFLDIVQRSYEPCDCPECGEKKDKIWCSNSLIDLCFKVDEPILDGLQDLIKGTLFLLDMDATLEKHRLIPSGHEGS
ncbi:MAG: hypothetical protein AAGF96_09715 [Bacteroidota bacterium]